MTMTKRNESYSYGYGYSAFAKHSAEIFSPAAQLVFSSVLSSDDTPPAAQSAQPPALCNPRLRHSHTHTHIHMTPMAHQKVAGPARPFKWPSGLEEIGGSRQEVGGRGVAMHWRPEIAYATSSAAVARLLRLPPVLVMAGEVKDGPRSSLLHSGPLWSSRVRCQNKKTQHDTPFSGIPPSLPPLYVLP